MKNHETGGWHREVINAATETTLRALRDANLLDTLYLAGGTGLALQFGHRLSRDLDFFAKTLFNEEILLQQIQNLAGFSLTARAPHTIHATIRGTKVSILGYKYPLLFPTISFENVSVADWRDIACMKITAIASRGTKRDFVDLYVAANRHGLAALLGLFAQKYARTQYQRLHVLKSLAFFGDADKDPMPHMLTKLDWSTVQQFFLREVPRIT